MKMKQFKDAKLKFPREWEFRIIIAEAARAGAEEGIAEVLKGRSIAVSAGESSRKGAYGTIVASQEELNELSEKLTKVPGVKFLL